MHSTSTVPERILLFGLYGSGKTHSWATIADMVRELKENAQFYAIGTERDAIGRLSDGYPNFKDNVQWTDTHDWYSIDDAAKNYVEQAKTGDFIIIEGIDKPWHWVQLLYDKLHGTPLDYDPKDPFAMERGMPGDDDKRDWVKINGVYRKWLNNILASPAHVVACGPQDMVRLPNPQKPKAWHDSKEVVEQYSQFGYKPAGQKELGHHFHSILHTNNPRKDVYEITTVDDHTRTRLYNTQINNFVLDYLVKVARWEM